MRWVVGFDQQQVLQPGEEIEVSADPRAAFTAERVLVVQGKDRVEVVGLKLGGKEVALDRDGSAAELIKSNGAVSLRVRNKCDHPTRWACSVLGWTS